MTYCSGHHDEDAVLGGSSTRFWRDEALQGAWLIDAHYQSHRFERHLHDEMVVVVTEQGSGEVQTRFAKESSRPGTVWVFAAGEYHSGRVVQDLGWRYRAIYLDEVALDAMAEVFSDRECPRPFVPPGLYEDPELAGLLASAHASAARRSSCMERQALWWSSMDLLFRRYGKPRIALQPLGNERAKLRAVREYISENHMNDLAIDELARVANLSRFHLMRSFKKEFGMPPHAYANQLKLISAKKKLMAGRPLADVAAEVGFYDQSHLTRLFKRAFDLTPGKFAALCRAAH